MYRYTIVTSGVAYIDMVQQGMYFQNFQNAQKIDLLLLYVTYDVLIGTAGYTDT